MDVKEFREAAHQVIRMCVEYRKNVHEMPVTTASLPGFMRNQLPANAPSKPESYQKALEDVEKYVIPGLAHWCHKQFYAYFSGGSSYPATLAEMLISGLGTVAYEWESCPVLAEFEHHVLDMMSRLINLPEKFRFKESNGSGGGMIQNSASEAIYNAMLAARNRALDDLGSDVRNVKYLKKLVAYCSTESHSCVEKAANMQQVTIRLLSIDQNHDMRGSTLEAQIRKDIEAGLHPFFVVGVFGSTSSAAIDNLVEIGEVLGNYPKIWFHVDGSYGGAHLLLDEFKWLLRGINKADSMNLNPYKCALVPADGVFLFTAHREQFAKSFGVEPKNSDLVVTPSEENALNPNSYARRFRALRLWITLRSYGRVGLTNYLRRCVDLAKRFANCVEKDKHLHLLREPRMGVVCFRVSEVAGRNTETITDELLSRINQANKCHFIPTKIQGIFVIRLAVVSEDANDESIDYAYDEIKTILAELLNEIRS